MPAANPCLPCLGAGAALFLPLRVRKREGGSAPFEAERIRRAILRAGQASGEFGEEEARKLALQVVKDLAGEKGGAEPHVEEIQDAVERALSASCYIRTARGYAVYREQRARLRRDKNTVVDVAASVNEYLDRMDWRVNANANQGYSLGGLILNVSGGYTWPSQ